MNQSDRPFPNPVVVLREEFDDWALLFNPDTADVVGVNPVGVIVWKLIDGKNGIEEIVAGVKNGFSDVTNSVTDEVTAIIYELSEKGFVGYEMEGLDR